MHVVRVGDGRFDAWTLFNPGFGADDRHQEGKAPRQNGGILGSEGGGSPARTAYRA